MGKMKIRVAGCWVWTGLAMLVGVSKHGPERGGSKRCADSGGRDEGAR